MAEGGLTADGAAYATLHRLGYSWDGGLVWTAPPGVPQPMTEARAREILGSSIFVTHTRGELLANGGWLSWSPLYAEKTATMNGEFTADELEAIAWWMRNKAQPCTR